MDASDHRAEPRTDANSDRTQGKPPVVPPDTTTWWDISKKSVNDAAYIQLRSELTAAISEFELLVERTESDGETWVNQGRILMGRAIDAMEEGAIDAAWRHLHTAKRLEIYGLEQLEEDTRRATRVAKRNEEGSTNREAANGIDADEGPVDPHSELLVRAAVVHEEALEKLDGWRRRAVVDLLGDDSGDLKERVTGTELRTASRILHEHYEDIYLVRSEQQRQFNQLVLMGVLSGLALFALSVVDWFLIDPIAGVPSQLVTFLETPFGQQEPNVKAPGFAVFVTVAGVMGASLFGMRSLRKRSLSANIPQQINQLTVTGARGVIGAISALLFYFALQAPLVWGGIDVTASPSVGAAMVVVGFAAGFNERMAPAVVAKVASITGTDAEENADSRNASDHSHIPETEDPDMPLDIDETDPTQ